MIDTNVADEPYFKALLTPYRSLGQTGFIVLMGILVAFWIALGGMFLSMGAWPVFGFFGLDVLLVYLAFRASYRSGRAREEVAVSRTRLDIRKITPSGKAEAHSFNPFWAKFSIARHEMIGITDMTVEGEGRRVTIGSFLNPSDRESFAAAFGQALATAKAR